MTAVAGTAVAGSGPPLSREVAGCLSEFGASVIVTSTCLMLWEMMVAMMLVIIDVDDFND